MFSQYIHVSLSFSTVKFSFLILFTCEVIMAQQADLLLSCRQWPGSFFFFFFFHAQPLVHTPCHFGQCHRDCPRCEPRILPFSESNRCYIGRQGCRERDYIIGRQYFFAPTLQPCLPSSEALFLGGNVYTKQH